MKPETRIRKRKARLLFARAHEVSAYFPPPKVERIVRERIAGIVAYFEMATVRMDREEYSRALVTLASSCYLQGAQDTATVAARMAAGERFDGVQSDSSAAPL